MDQPQLLLRALWRGPAGFFAGSELSAYGRAADDRERELLKPFAAQIPPDILDGSYRLPVTDGSGRDRATLRGALDAVVARPATISMARCCGSARPKRPSPSKSWSRPATRSGSRWPIAAISSAPASRRQVRAVDPVQFDQRRLGYEFDMIQNRWDQSLSPGNEQSFYWGSEAADIHRHAKLHGRQGPGDRRPDRGPAGGARACRFRLGGAGAGSGPDVGFLRYPAV